MAKWKKRTSVSDLPTGPKDAKSTTLSIEEDGHHCRFPQAYPVAAGRLPLRLAGYDSEPDIPQAAGEMLAQAFGRIIKCYASPRNDTCRGQFYPPVQIEDREGPFGRVIDGLAGFLPGGDVSGMPAHTELALRLREAYAGGAVASLRDGLKPTDATLDMVKAREDAPKQVIHNFRHERGAVCRNALG